jgi:hypothetical protein
MRAGVCRVVIGGLLTLGFLNAARAAGLLPDGVYRLTPEAAFQRGCFPPCLCPVMESGPMRGTFRLTYESSDPLFDHYAVTGVHWIAAVGDTELRIVGAGTYQIGGEFALTQRMQLDLWVDAGPWAHFDSGLVPIADPKQPGMDITVSINGMYCFDTALRVAALPVPRDEVVSYTLGGGSQYQEGCWPPCDCMLNSPQPVTGTFGLVPLQTGPLFMEYAVVDVNWLIDGRPPTQGDPRVTGGGTYRVGGEVAVMQQMVLDLSFGAGDPVRFDSGLVPGGGSFPAIDITIDLNGFVCFDQAFYLHARPQGPVLPGDLNCDGVVDFDDISPFVAALASRQGYEARYPLCNWLNGDVDANGDVNFDDISPFVKCLVHGGCP